MYFFKCKKQMSPPQPDGHLCPMIYHPAFSRHIKLCYFRTWIVIVQESLELSGGYLRGIAVFTVKSERAAVCGVDCCLLHSQGMQIIRSLRLIAILTILFVCSNFSNYRNRFSMPGQTEGLWYRQENRTCLDSKIERHVLSLKSAVYNHFDFQVFCFFFSVGQRSAWNQEIRHFVFFFSLFMKQLFKTHSGRS